VPVLRRPYDVKFSFEQVRDGSSHFFLVFS
jgi:hypothetical protein